MRLLLIGMLSSALFGCASLDRPRCASGETATVSDVLYFGMAKPTGGTVTQDEWSAFLRTSVTRRFPAGLTVWPASGQWRGLDGQIVREDSYVLSLLHPFDAAAESSIQAIVDEYKKQFAQEAVLRVRSQACMSL